MERRGGAELPPLEGHRPILLVESEIGHRLDKHLQCDPLLVAREGVPGAEVRPEAEGRIRLASPSDIEDVGVIELSLVAANPSVAASYSGVQRPGEPRRVTGERRDGIEWQVIQTVVPIGAAPAVRKEVS